MKILPIILGFSLWVLPYHHTSTPFLWSQAPTTLTIESVSVEFNIKPVDYTKTIDMNETKIAYAQKISADLFKAVEQRNLIVAGKSEDQLNQEVVQLAHEK